MGEHARRVQERLRDALAREDDREWHVEHHVAGTPVDLAGVEGGPADDDSADGTLAVVELEWRRADPADNAAKLFRHLADGRFDAGVTVCQVFTGYYDLRSGGVSSKRHNAEFVGRVAARTHDGFAYHPVDLAVDPPKRGGDLPADWRGAVDDAAGRVADALDQ